MLFYLEIKLVIIIYNLFIERELNTWLQKEIAGKSDSTIFEQFDAHANNAQVDALKTVLEKKYKINCAAYTPKNGTHEAYIA